MTEKEAMALRHSVRQYEEKSLDREAVRALTDAIDKIKTMKKNGELTEDDVKDGEKRIQEITDKRCKEADAIAEAKQQEIMEV